MASLTLSSRIDGGVRLPPVGEDGRVAGLTCETVRALGQNWVRKLNFLRIAPSQVRALTVAIPDGAATYDQMTAIYQAYQYGIQQGASVQYVMITG